MTVEATLRRPDLLEELADRLHRAEQLSQQAHTEVLTCQRLFGRLSLEAEAIAAQKWPRSG